jgi:hypothetical protein
MHTLCPSAREHIFVAIPVDLLRKTGVLMQKACVGQGKAKMDRMVRRRGVTLRSSLKVAV